MRLKSIYYFIFSLLTVFLLAACSDDDDDSKKLNNQFQLNNQEPVSIHDIGLELDGRETLVGENFIHSVIVVGDGMMITSYGDNHMDVEGEAEMFSFRITSSNSEGLSDGIFSFTTEDDDMITQPVFDEFVVYGIYGGDVETFSMTGGQITVSSNAGVNEFHVLGIVHPVDEFGDLDLTKNPIEFKASFKGEIPTYNKSLN